MRHAGCCLQPDPPGPASPGRARGSLHPDSAPRRSDPDRRRRRPLPVPAAAATVVRRIVAAWRAFWFAPAPLVDLGVARAIVAGIFLLLDPRTRYLRVAFIPPPLWKPLPLVAALGLPQPGLATLQWMGVVTTALLIAAALGVLARAALTALVPLVLLQEAWLNSAGKITHGTIPLVWALVFLVLSPCDRRFTVGEAWRRIRGHGASGPVESGHARWPLLLVFAEIAAFYCAAGVTKLRTSGLAWADGWTLQYFLLTAGTPAGLWIAGSRSLCAALS